MDNAVNHTSNGTIRLGCSMVGIARDDCSLRITVADTGEGMRPEFLHLLEQVLGNEDIYVQKWREQGYGLGLPLVCRIFRLMNGNMHISSELGRGTVCVCTAHFAYNEDDQRQNNILSNKRALLCDLDLSSRAMHVNLLNSFSMQVSEFSSVLPALSELAEADAHGAGYDFFILSRCSDGLDNHEIIRHVRQEMHLSKIPQIIAISHFGRDDAIYVMKKSGVDACLHVPINGSLMFDALAMLDGADGASPLDQDGCFTADSISSFTGMRVLLVEDNRLHQQMAVTLMEEAGMEVTAVFNGSEALKALSVCRDGYGFDLVLMDMQMPEMDGFETTWRIRKDSYLNAVYIPIIALTAHRGTHEVNAYRKIGMDDHVPKPVDREVFFTVLHRWLPLAADNSGESVKFLRELGQLLESDAHKASKRFSEYGRHLRRSLGGGRAGKLRRMIDEQEYGKAGDFITHLLDKLDGYLTEQPYDSTERDKAADHIFD
jgi:CheY-like chemotaxis protein